MPINYNFLLDHIKKWLLQIAPSARNKNYAGHTADSVNNSTAFLAGYHLAQKRAVQ